MKTKDLIEALQEADPTGEEEVSVGNADIFYVAPDPAYWDGCQEVLLRDPSKRNYNVVGAKYRCNGTKIVIHTLSVEGAIENNPHMQVDFSELEGNYPSGYQRYTELVEEWRKSTIEIRMSVEREHFCQWVHRQLGLKSYSDEIDKKAKEFFAAHLSWEDPMPKHLNEYKEDGKGGKYLPSWNDRREMQWSEDIEVNQNGDQLDIKKCQIEPSS